MTGLAVFFTVILRLEIGGFVGMNREQILDELRSELKVGNHIIGVAIELLV